MRTVEAGYRLVNPRLNEWSLCTSIRTLVAKALAPDAAGGGCRVPSLRHRHTRSHPPAG
jgi:hypothetical protein